MDMDALYKAINNFGLPVTLLVIIMWALWKIAKWSGVNLIQPVVQRHLEFLSKLENRLDAQSRTLEAQTQSQLAQTKSLEEISRNQEKLSGIIEGWGSDPPEGSGLKKLPR